MLHRILVIGGGAGGLELVTRLSQTLVRRGLAQVTLVDGNLTHMWKPLLHEVAAGTLDLYGEEVSYAAQGRQHGFTFIHGRMEGLDRQRRIVRLAAWKGHYSPMDVPAREVVYDTLVIAVGSTGNDYGVPGVLDHAVFLDSAAQAEALRLGLLEIRAARNAKDANEPIRVAIVGGGATGVELSAELVAASHAWSRHGTVSPSVDVTLIEAGSRLLPALPQPLADAVTSRLTGLGVKVRIGVSVKQVTARGLLSTHGETFAVDKVVWAAGVCAPSFLAHLDGLETNHGHQVAVQSTLQTTRDADVFAMGDCAACPRADDDPRFVPPLAQAAHQQARFLADNLQRRIEGRPMGRFAFVDRGTLVSLASFQTFGWLFDRWFIAGALARVFYAMLYRLHQSVLFGPWRVARMAVGQWIERGRHPWFKWH